MLFLRNHISKIRGTIILCRRGKVLQLGEGFLWFRNMDIEKSFKLWCLRRIKKGKVDRNGKKRSSRKSK